jgi:hypothetical protein
MGNWEYYLGSITYGLGNDPFLLRYLSRLYRPTYDTFTKVLWFDLVG